MAGFWSYIKEWEPRLSSQACMDIRSKWFSPFLDQLELRKEALCLLPSLRAVEAHKVWQE